jgi:hypothetical protein
MSTNQWFILRKYIEKPVWWPKKILPQIRDEIKFEDFPKALVINPREDASQPKGNSQGRDEDLGVMVGWEHGRASIEV